MAHFRKLSEGFWASPQIDSADIEEAARAGFTLVINNRPDNEEAGQPSGADIAAAAKAAGLGYLAIPVDHSGLSDELIAQMAQALADAGEDAKILAYCRSGTRSTFLWSLTQASRGADPDGIIAAAAEAGYDVSPLRGTMSRLVIKARG